MHAFQDELVAALWKVAKDNGWRVRQFTATPEAPFASHVSTMARTGVLVARHGATLASSFLLPSGAAVYELLPYNWEWRNLNQIYRNMTRSTGRLHHFAWRATDPKWAVYAEPQDYSRYAHFRASECTSRYVKEFMTRWVHESHSLRHEWQCTAVENPSSCTRIYIVV